MSKFYLVKIQFNVIDILGRLGLDSFFQAERSYVNGFISFVPQPQFMRSKPPVDSYHTLKFVYGGIHEQRT